MKGISAREVTKLSVEHWLLNYGPVTDLLFYNGSQFTSKVFQDVCYILNNKNVFTTTFSR